MKPTVLQPSPAGSYQAVEQSIIDRYQNDIDDLKQLWLGADTVDKRKLGLHIEFIISKIPFEDTRKKIKETRAKLEKEFKASADPAIRQDAEIRASFAAVTGVMEFIFEKFELVHEDITGPGTSREYQKAIVEIPDMPTERQSTIVSPEETGFATGSN